VSRYGRKAGLILTEEAVTDRFDEANVDGHCSFSIPIKRPV